nr:MAG TPA: hypothetical protein [Caudoviricetes sp.]
MTTDIINEVAGELGITATNIIPELTKLKIMQNAFWCCVCAVIALICLFIFIKETKKEDPDEVLTIFCLCMFVFLFICTLGFGYDLANWLTSPQIKAMYYILDKLR